MEHAKEDRILPECREIHDSERRTLEDTKADINKLYGIVNGIPQEIEAMKENVSRLCDTMEKLMGRLESNYISKQTYDGMKESYDLRMEALKNEVRVMKENDIKELKDTNKWATRGILVTALAVIIDLFKSAFTKIFS